ncbi:MAG TPA: protein-disulfide reductase DsbD family protein [Verrucomicrobiota bacterium]|nr:protein-disulfide reductase DsbD family protein [Verrucomicrobiota bacterium]
MPKSKGRLLKALNILVASIALSVAAADAAPHTRASLLLDATTAKPGDTILAGVRLEMDEHWHTYWQYPGASGAATKIKWKLPDGITAGEIQWPVPEKLPAGDDDEFTTYVYHDEVVLLVPLTIASDVKTGRVELAAHVAWLECEKLCLPGDSDVSATLEIGDSTTPSQFAGVIKEWQRKLPRSGDVLSAQARWEKAATGDTRPLLLEWNVTESSGDWDFFPLGHDSYDIQPATTIVSSSGDRIVLRKTVQKFDGDWPVEVSGVIVRVADGVREGYAVTLPVGGGARTRGTVAPETGETTGSRTPVVETEMAKPTRPLWLMLLAALVGGLILNIMPCVLPVISLKILGFVSQSREHPAQVRKLGLIYTAGVLVSFLALAAVVIGVKAAGGKAAWGMQFGNPVFVVCLTVLVTLVALNLFGVFEVTLSGRVMDSAGGLSSKHGAAGAFFNGVLATILATPCTAPVLGFALGFAFAQPPPLIVLMFLAVGLGLALPYLLLSWKPAWLRFLPKPGAWMEKFKMAMGFPMLATAVWLFTLAQSFYGKRLLWLGVFLVLLALAAWIFGEFYQRGAKRRSLALVLVLVLLVGGYAYAIEGELRWRSPLPPEQAVSLKESPDGIDWQPWSAAAVAKARAEGRPVFVDFTADWCVTCQFNKKTSIEISSVRAKLKAINAVSLLGDYTRLPPDITDELNRFGRAGVPLVLVYPRNASEPPIILPEALTPGIVLNALERAEQ